MAAKKAIYSILDLKGNVIQNVGAPSLDTDVATKGSAGTDATTKANAAQAAAEATAASLASAAQAAAVASANSYTDSEITALVNGAPLALDTLKELADALSDQGDAVAALVTTINGVASDLADEVTDRTNADSALDTRLTAVEGDVSTLDTTVGGLVTDVGALQTDVSGLQSDVSGLQSDVSGIQSDLAGKLNIATGSATGSGTSTAEGYEYTITHNLGKANVIAQVYDGNDVVDVVIRKVNNNSLKIITGSVLGATTLDVVVAG